MVDYKYTQDFRTKEEYRLYVENGVKNQHMAIEQLIKDWRKEGYSIKANWLDKDESFKESMEQFTGYTPDVELEVITPRGAVSKRKYEVKVSQFETKDTLDIKCFQIDRIVNYFPGGYLFYSTPTKYFTLEARIIQITFQRVFSARIGEKECYRLDVPALFDLWNFYESSLDLLPYFKARKKGTFQS